MRDRTYEWNWELDDGAETPCLVKATVSGSDTNGRRDSWNGDTPPEYREVEISVYTALDGGELTDVTETCSMEFFSMMDEIALTKDHEQAEADYEDSCYGRYREE
jgi:hypothetical protein